MEGISATASASARKGERYRGLVVERLGINADVLFARGFLLVVFFHPGGEAFSSGGIAPGEREAGDFAVSDGELVRLVLRHHADEAIGERWAFDLAIEYVPFNSLPVFQCDGQIAAVVKRFLHRLMYFRYGSQRRNPAFEILVDDTEVFFGGGFRR